MTILFTGDSITDCGRNREWPLSLGQGYAIMAAGELSYRLPDKGLVFYNTGISGNKVTDLLARWQRDCININPGLLSILIGINDLWHHVMGNEGLSLPLFKQEYGIILEQTRARLPNAKTILCEPFLLNADAIKDEYPILEPELNLRRQAVKELADMYGCTFIPLQEAFDKACKTAPPEYWAVDGIHPSHAGNMLIAREWIKYAEGNISKI